MHRILSITTVLLLATATLASALSYSITGFVNNAHVLAINNRGQMAGMWYSGAEIRAFLYSAATGMQDLAPLGEIPYAEGWGINDRGQVVGISSTPGGGAQAFLYDAATGMQSLGSLDETSQYSEAKAINNRGQVVGHSYVGRLSHAFLYDAATGMKDLGTLGGGFSRATAINNSVSRVMVIEHLDPDQGQPN